MLKFYFLFTFFISLTQHIKAKNNEIIKPASLYIGGDTTYRIIPAVGNTYGYDILVKNRLLIHQPSIPGMPGNKGFAKKTDAEKVARLIIKKMGQGMMPPTIEPKELETMKIKL